MCGTKNLKFPILLRARSLQAGRFASGRRSRILWIVEINAAFLAAVPEKHRTVRPLGVIAGLEEPAIAILLSGKVLPKLEIRAGLSFRHRKDLPLTLDQPHVPGMAVAIRAVRHDLCCCRHATIVPGLSFTADAVRQGHDLLVLLEWILGSQLSV